MPQRPSVKRESKYAYVEKSSGKRLSFTPVSDEIVATFDDTRPAEGMAAIRKLDTAALFATQPRLGFAVLRTTDVNAAASSLADAAPVANSLPVMLDNEGLRRYFLPDEFTVQFADGVTPTDAEDALREMGAGIRRRQRTRGYYTASVPEGAGLFDTITAMSNRADVLFAEPSEFGIDDALDARSKASPALTDAGQAVAEKIADLVRRWTPATEVMQPSVQEDVSAADAESDAQALPADTDFGRLVGSSQHRPERERHCRHRGL